MLAQNGYDNLGFETWTQNVVGDDVPEGFPLSNGASENTMDPNEGSSALKIEAEYISNPQVDDTLGGITNGEFTGSGPVPGDPYTQRPDSVTGYVRTNVPTEDTAGFIFSLTKYVSSGDSTMTVGSAGVYLGDNIGNWTKVSIPFNYDTSATPDSIIIQFSTHVGDQPAHTGAILEADGFTIHNSSTSSLEEGGTDLQTSVYPNPSDGRFQVRMEQTSTGSYEIRDMNGRLVREKDMNGRSRFDVNMEEAEQGIYFIRLKDRNGETEAVQKLVIR